MKTAVWCQLLTVLWLSYHTIRAHMLILSSRKLVKGHEKPLLQLLHIIRKNSLEFCCWFENSKATRDFQYS